MRDEFLNMEVFRTINEANVITKQCVLFYNTIRSHSSLNYKTPEPLTVQEIRF
jgi:transposase InsO family protein